MQINFLTTAIKPHYQMPRCLHFIPPHIS